MGVTTVAHIIGVGKVLLMYIKTFDYHLEIAPCVKSKQGTVITER